LEGFSYVLQIDMHFICTPMWTKFYSCKKWVLQQACHELVYLSLGQSCGKQRVYQIRVTDQQ
jgi:hypothetical protein